MQSTLPNITLVSAVDKLTKMRSMRGLGLQALLK